MVQGARVSKHRGDDDAFGLVEHPPPGPPPGPGHMPTVGSYAVGFDTARPVYLVIFHRGGGKDRGDDDSLGLVGDCN